ncbi:protease modulator HflK [Erythrobacter jejuensis]|uniref:Protease modulator HflK n=2 Tax=Parerythrobacter jejuensis TaxID=795812 RepID=A0A845AQY8_9SPHN|nr:protease modulator HflK [Parerythrobacter jejuensis]MXP34065.1 protease modulator HflK [Parerythrobacter jejuensis]
MAGKSPWGGSNGSGNGESGGEGGGGDTPSSGDSKGPRNPWLPPGKGEEPRRSASIEDIFKNRGPEGPRRSGGGGGGGPNFRLPQRPGGKSWLPLIIAGVAGAWLFFSSVHQVGPKEQGVVSTFGQYSRTLQPGLNFTAPWPFQNVDIMDVSTFRSERVGSSGEKLILTGDQNLVDLSYLIRWNIKDLKQYKYQLAEPVETVEEVAEFAMRASVAEKELDDVLSGSGRADIEQRVRSRMQATLDAYRSGIAVQGIEIEKTDPPERVIEAFKDVSAAQQNAETDINRARAFAQQVLARAQGDAASFDKIYEEYRLAPEVTRRRLYYETMESVLSKTDKTVIEAEGVTPYLPLPEVRRRSQANAQAAEGGQ